MRRRWLDRRTTRSCPHRRNLWVLRPRGCGLGRPSGRGAALESLDPLQQGLERGVGVAVGQAHERHFERDARVGCLAHLDAALAQHLERPGARPVAEPLGPAGDLGPVGLGQVAERRRPCGGGTRRAGGRAAPRRAPAGRGPRRTASATASEARRRCRASTSASTSSSTASPRSSTPPAATTWSSADSVSRAEPPPPRTTWSIASSSDVEAGVVDDPAHVLGQLVGRQQVELEVLGAAADGGQHLLRVGGGQHEHDVVGRLLERLQQRVRRRRSRACGPRRGCTPWCARACRGRRLGDEVADGVDAVVRRGVELVDVEATCRPRSPGTTRTRRTARRPTRLLAVERLGEDAGRRGLAGAARAAEQVGVADPVRRARRCAGRCTTCSWPRPRRTAGAGSGGRATGRPSAPTLPAPASPTVGTRHAAGRGRTRSPE